ncbi:MAG: histidinol dehydrogenase, partial [Gemmatimonadaceae bacterium]|nr:histidinol dehydrogenase [Gemmatimonadaceae bacterium]
EPGIIVGRRPDPFDAVGVYAPGGTASYPSSVLMGAVPARAAGVQTVVLATPPGKGGLPSQAVLAAAALAGVDRVFAIGGAGAIAALAFGTETIPRVAKIVGPGNAFVAEAKLQVSGITSIDSPAGPSEVLVIADSSADADVIAAELLAQAEHDTRASVIALLIAPYSLESVLDAIEHRLQKEPRRNIAARALAERGAVLQCDSIEQAIEFANRYAAEHLLLALQNPEAVLPAICNAGTVCLGASSSVVFGDYMTGANHVLPTGGMGRAFSGLSALDFVRWTSYQSVTPEAARRLAVPVSVFAEYEGLSAHAGAARIWSER